MDDKHSPINCILRFLRKSPWKESVNGHWTARGDKKIVCVGMGDLFCDGKSAKPASSLLSDLSSCHAPDPFPVPQLEERREVLFTEHSGEKRGSQRDRHRNGRIGPIQLRRGRIIAKRPHAFSSPRISGQPDYSISTTLLGGRLIWRNITG